MYLSLKEAAAYLGYAESGLRDVVTRSRLQMAAGLPPDLQFAQGRRKGKILFRREWLDDFVAITVEPREAQPARLKKQQSRVTSERGLEWASLAL